MYQKSINSDTFFINVWLGISHDDFFFLHNSTATWTISPLEIFISDLKYNQIRESISLAQLPQNKTKQNTNKNQCRNLILKILFLKTALSTKVLTSNYSPEKHNHLDIWVYLLQKIDFMIVWRLSKPIGPSGRV